LSVAIITGSAGLVGAEAARLFAAHGYTIVGIDNNMRQQFFGEEASTAWSRDRLAKEVPTYRHNDCDIRDTDAITRLFKHYRTSISVVIHAAAQPSHDWAARDPILDFSVNANGTLNMLEATRLFAPDAAFVFTSTNKVYGDTPNRLPLCEQESRWEVSSDHPYARFGIDEAMSIDTTLHSVFGASKVAADIMTQEYGRYFEMNTACFRGGCLTGPGHSGAALHGFLAYLVQCAVKRTPYVVRGYRAKQVRDNIHARDLVNAFWHYCQEPRRGEVYNIGGSRHSNCSMLEAIHLIEEMTGDTMNWSYEESNRVGDHIWWISDVRKFQSHYPAWDYEYDLASLLKEIHEGVLERV
jgi:CDP-paratose 2-epimerase